jgi:hypothetical protein
MVAMKLYLLDADFYREIGSVTPRRSDANHLILRRKLQSIRPQGRQRAAAKFFHLLQNCIAIQHHQPTSTWAFSMKGQDNRTL